MAYHEAFWVAVAAAAPVIALANTVSITDVVNLWTRFKIPRTKMSLQSISGLQSIYITVVFISSVNLVVQANAMYTALRSLFAEHDLGGDR